MPQVKKNTFVILTISLAMMIAVIGSSLLNTIQHNERNYVKKQYATDIQVVDRLENSSSINPEQLKQRISELEGIEEVSTVSRLSPAKQDKTEGLSTMRWLIWMRWRLSGCCRKFQM